MFASRSLGLCVGLVLMGQASLAWSQGLIVSSAGPVNRSMGGAAVAAPIDALGAIYWNPATISGLRSSETAFGLDMLIANQTVSSSVGPYSGSTDAEPGVFPIPNIGWVHKTKFEPLTIGLGVNGIAGFKTNLRADPTNPALMPSPVGLGRVSSEACFMQLAPVASLAVSERLSIAAGPTITTGQLSVDPFVFAAPNSNGHYASGQATRYHWGGGFQTGAYYIYNEAVRFGASYKSPSWMERFEFYSEDALGNPRPLLLDFDLPMIVSVGASIVAGDGWLVALDLRFIDFAGAAGLGDRAIFDSSGRLGGLDWSSVFVSALGIEKQVNDSWTVRGGYTYNQNPIKNSEAFYSIASPLIYQHTLSSGLSYHVSEALSANLGYSYLLENTRHGQLISPAIGPIPGSSIANAMDAHFLSFGLTIRQ